MDGLGLLILARFSLFTELYILVWDSIFFWRETNLWGWFWGGMWFVKKLVTLEMWVCLSTCGSWGFHNVKFHETGYSGFGEKALFQTGLWTVVIKERHKLSNCKLPKIKSFGYSDFHNKKQAWFICELFLSVKVWKSAFAKLVALKRAGCCPFRTEGVQAV